MFEDFLDVQYRSDQCLNFWSGLDGGKIPIQEKNFKKMEYMGVMIHLWKIYTPAYLHSATSVSGSLRTEEAWRSTVDSTLIPSPRSASTGRT